MKSDSAAALVDVAAAPAGRTRASRGSSRGSVAPTVRPAGRSTGRSLALWTATSIVAAEQRVLDLLDEETLAAGGGKRARRRGDRRAVVIGDDLARPALAFERRRDLVGLPQRERAAACADAERRRQRGVPVVAWRASRRRRSRRRQRLERQASGRTVSSGRRSTPASRRGPTASSTAPSVPTSSFSTISRVTSSTLRARVGSERPELRLETLQLRPSNRLEALTQGDDGRHRIPAAQPAEKPLGLFLDDGLRRAQPLDAPRPVLVDDRLEVVDVVEEHLLEIGRPRGRRRAARQCR